MTPVQREFLRSVVADSTSETRTNWFHACPDDNPRTIKALEKKGLIEIDPEDPELFRLTEAGIEKGTNA